MATSPLKSPTMFRREVQSFGTLLDHYLREAGLETPLLQRRLLDAWPKVAGDLVARYTLEKRIYNQTLMVKISNPALRADLSMMRSQYVKRLNAAVGATVIVDVRFF